ncbi:N-acetylmuramic acid 6-phosphate etherase [Litorivicinus lipolyticus]|uniref:N-acetylmuramic acid 6-phosphate etherase n=1 Tax=Litorivicinus lipolyticus TaxID=418701 RepID=UPI003B5A89DC
MTLNTEQLGAFAPLEEQTTATGLACIIQAQAEVVGRLAQNTAALAEVVDASAARLRSGNGRLVYAGAGASGRIAVQDGVELWPTFGWPHERLVYLMAGGQGALVSSIEGAEDDEASAIAAVKALKLTASDVVIGVAASGNTPYVAAVLTQARVDGALTVALFNNPDCRMATISDLPVWLDSGPEVINGSTRLNAATTQKAALNAISTMLMVRLNRTYQNIMVDMAADNLKLAVRRTRMLQAIAPELSDGQAQDLLQRAQGSVKLAVCLNLGLSPAQAAQRLDAAQGSLATVLAAPP